jgi:hypothetical protein
MTNLNLSDDEAFLRGIEMADAATFDAFVTSIIRMREQNTLPDKPMQVLRAVGNTEPERGSSPYADHGTLEACQNFGQPPSYQFTEPNMDHLTTQAHEQSSVTPAAENAARYKISYVNQADREVEYDAEFSSFEALAASSIGYHQRFHQRTRSSL